MRKFAALSLPRVCLLSAIAVADDDPPSRAVRLSYMAGTGNPFNLRARRPTGFRPTVNRALTKWANKIWVEQGGRHRAAKR